MGEKGGLFKGLAILGAVVLALACCGMLLTLCERPAAAMERCAGVVCKLRSGCWPREPDTGAYHWDAMVFGLEQGELGCAGHSKTLTLRDWRGRKYDLQIMELTDRRTEEGAVLWFRTRDFRMTGTP
jgi:hypothetical protein